MSDIKQMTKIVERVGKGQFKDMAVIDLREDQFTTDTGTAGSLLIPTTIFATMQSAVRKALVFRRTAALIVGPSGVPGSSLNINLQDVDSMTVFEVAEGAEIPMDKETYTNRDATPKKYAVRIAITKEMVEDSQFDLMRMNSETAGYALADNEDQLVVAQLNAADTAATHSIANNNATLTTPDITAAMQKLEEDKYTATDMVIGVECANDLRNNATFTEANKAGVNDPSQRLIGQIFGMNVTVSNNVSNKLAYVFDRRKAYAIVEKRPLTLTNWQDYSRDSSQMAATQRVAAVYLYANATSEITTL